MDNNGTLVKMTLLEDGLMALTTVDRRHGRNGRFLICGLREWIENETDCTFRDSYCGNFLECKLDREKLHFSVVWLGGTDENLRGFRQTFEVPVSFGTDGGKCVYHERERCAKIRTTERANVLIRKAMSDVITASAFKKAMRDCFWWNTSVPTSFVHRLQLLLQQNNGR